MKFRMIWLGPDDEPEPQPLPESEGASNRSAPPFPYEKHSGGLIRRELSVNNRRRIIPLTSFSARIVADRILDDGDEQHRGFVVEAEVGTHKVLVELAATEFGRMGWVLSRLGPSAIIYPGQQQHARAAIQSLSGTIRQEHIFAHLGWRQLGSDWIYLQAGGAVGAQGLRRDVPVQMNAGVQHYQIALPADADDRRRAVRASLQLLRIAPERITLPLLAGVYRAVLGKVGFSLFLVGPSGAFKTALATLCQQHFGAAMDAGCLPGSFTSTGNALEELAFAAKDALLVVDDFVPVGGVGDGALQGIAERLFRAAGNHQGRSRLDGHGQVRTARPPRGLILATGEEAPRGQSLRARLLIVDVAEGEVEREKLSESQSAGANGWLSQAMGAFLQWMAGRYEAIQTLHRQRTVELRNEGYGGAAHHRLPTAVAELQSGWEIWLEFALQTGTIGTAERRELVQKGILALGELAVRQAAYQQDSDPATRFLVLLRAALAGGQAHLVDRRGKAPQDPLRWGWRRQRAGGRWSKQGTAIGWTWEDHVYLEPSISYQVAQRVAGCEPLPVSEQSLRQRMHARGLLASIDTGRQMLLIRRIVEGFSRQLLHLKASHLAN